MTAYVNIMYLRELARILENIVASFPAAFYRPLYYRHLEQEIADLKYHKDNFKEKITLSTKAKAEIKRLINNINNSCNHINIPNPDIIIYTDLICTDWGVNYGLLPSRELLNKAELEHINVLELKVIEMGICTYCKNKFFLHFRVMCDNVATICQQYGVGK